MTLRIMPLDELRADVSLIESSGAVSSGRMHGTMWIEQAVSLAKVIGRTDINILWDDRFANCQYGNPTPEDYRQYTESQRSLFQ